MMSQYLREKSVSLSVVLPTFRRGGTKGFHFLFVLLRFDDVKKQAVKQSTFPLTLSTSAESSLKSRRERWLVFLIKVDLQLLKVALIFLSKILLPR